MHQNSVHSLREDACFKESEGHHRYILPLTTDDAHSVFDSLNRALWSLKPLAKEASDEDYNSAFVYAYRRFGRIFKTAYDYKPDEVKETHMPTVGDVYSDMMTWHDGIPPRTFTIEKTENNLFLSYEEGFFADDEVISIGKEETDELLARGIRACGQGIKNEHTPYNPSITEKWRYNPSKVRFSIEMEDGVVRMGVDNQPPKQPLWYRGYKHLSTLSRPYAYTTFDMENQTSVVKFTYNNGRGESEHI